MKVIWTPRAANDLAQAAAYIEQHNPDAAVRVAARIYKRIMELESTPEVGRAGIVPGTRELIFRPWKYIAVYKVSGNAVRVLRVRHSAQLYP